jgi:ribonucleoside-diphosphate reductase alpha chain
VFVPENYRDVFFSPATHDVLVRGNIIQPDQDARWLLQALLRRLELVEENLTIDRRETSTALADLESLIAAGVCVLGSPLLTNVAFDKASMGSCAAVPLPIGEFGALHAEAAASHYRLNMGSGFCLDSTVDPVSMLQALNAHASELTKRRACQRYIGNMAHLSVHHPRIRDFIAAKVARADLLHFNISVDVSDAFMDAVERDAGYQLWDGTVGSARRVWSDISECAWLCGDPGIISLGRFNAGNALPVASPYVTTAPCAEVGLAPGETCVFGYINLAACLKVRSETFAIDDGMLIRAAQVLTRVLDDAVQDSISGTTNPQTSNVMSLNRKIGIGVCGFADALIMLNLEYGSEEACAWLNQALSIVDYASKQASVELSSQRGPFGAFASSRYAVDSTFLARKRERASSPGEATWLELEHEVRRWGLRNVMTTALPPSGRTSLLLGVNGSIEPFLSFDVTAHAPLICRHLRNCECEHGEQVPSQDVPNATCRSPLFRTAVEIGPYEHLAVLFEAAALVDDGVSKTINLPDDTSSAGVSDVLLAAWQGGLKAVSVFRNSGAPPACHDLA